MADENLDAVANIAVAASDAFKQKYSNAETSVGVISSTVRSMGIEADAVNIDCLHSGKRLVLIILDRLPERVGIGIGQKDTIGDYELVRQVPVGELSHSDILELLETRFVK